MTIADHKAALRRDAMARRRDAARAQPDAGAALRDNFLAAIVIPAGAIVSGFWPMGDEIDVKPLMHALIARGHRIALPCVAGRGKPLVFRAWAPGDTLIPGTLGTSTPSDDKPALTPDVVIAPLLAFDRRGYRLGYGAGYYDLTLAHLRAGGGVLAVGVGYDAQEADALPAEPWDQPVDWIVTERRALPVRS